VVLDRASQRLLDTQALIAYPSQTAHGGVRLKVSAGPGGQFYTSVASRNVRSGDRFDSLKKIGDYLDNERSLTTKHNMTATRNQGELSFGQKVKDCEKVIESSVVVTISRHN
jgi:hypothetical protein